MFFITENFRFYFAYKKQKLTLQKRKIMELNYKSFGSGEPLIILHGLFGMLDNWQILAKKFAKTHEVFTIDLRNHGKSPHNPEHSYAVMARDIYDFLEEQNIFNASILGHSMGGKVAMQFASYFPGFVKKLIVADMAPKTYDTIREDHQNIFKAIDLLEENNFKERSEAEDALKAIIKVEKIYLFIFKNMTYDEDGRVSWKFNPTALKENYQEMMKNISAPKPVKVPTLFIKGGKSDYIDLNEFDGFKKFFPQAELKIIEEAGHWIHADAPQEFSKIVIDFLNK
jgi:esterase